MTTIPNTKDFRTEITEKVLQLCNDDVTITGIKNVQFHSFASTTNHVSFETSEKKYFASVLGPYISRNNLEFEVKLLWSLQEMGFPSVRVARIGTRYIHKVMVDNSMHSVIFYEYLDGEMIPYNQMSDQRIADIFSQIGELHCVLGTFLPMIDRHAMHYRRSRYSNILMSLNDQGMNYYIEKNFNALSEIKLTGIREKWNEYAYIIPKVREYFVNMPRQIIHGDLSQANILVTGDDFTFIDFHDSEYAPREWDLAWAMVHWWKWQEVVDFEHFLPLALDAYSSVIDTTYIVDVTVLKEMITAAFLIMLEMGLTKPEIGNNNTQAKHLVDTSLYYLYNENIL